MPDCARKDKVMEPAASEVIMVRNYRVEFISLIGVFRYLIEWIWQVGPGPHDRDQTQPCPCLPLTLKLRNQPVSDIHV